MADFKVEILKHPTNEDWMICKKCTLVTVGKDSEKPPTDEWKQLGFYSSFLELQMCRTGLVRIWRGMFTRYLLSRHNGTIAKPIMTAGRHHRILRSTCAGV